MWRIPEEDVQAFYKDGVECQDVNRGSTCGKGDPAPFLPYYKHWWCGLTMSHRERIVLQDT